MTDLGEIYRAYIACLNRQDWTELGTFVAANVHHNGRAMGLAGYRAMLEQNFRDIPDLHFTVERLVCDKVDVASRLIFHCAPKASFLGLAVNGRKVTFAENIFYEFRDSKIAQAWSIIDKAAIEEQLSSGR